MNSIIVAALRQRILVLVMLVGVFIGGAVAFMNLNIEAYPDPVPPLVDIIVQSPGSSAEEMERYMTIPVEIQMAGIPNITAIRTISLFGLSDIKVQFTYDFTYEQAEQWVINRLSQMPPLPNGVTPQISPESPIGEIMRYRVVGPPGYSVTDLKTIEDWMLERRFKAVPGVVDVNGWGGKTKTYAGHAQSVQADRLRADGAAGAGGAEQRQRQCRRPDGEFWRPGGGGARCRPDPQHRRNRRHDGLAEQRLAGPDQGRGDGDRIQPAAARHRRAGQRQRHRHGHRADAARRRKHADHQAGGSADRPDQRILHPAAGRAYRAVLRPVRPDQRHHPHRAAQHGGGHAADLRPAMGVPGQPAQRDDRLGHHPVRPGLRHRPAAAARQIRQPAVSGRDRLRPGGRCHRHHGGKHRSTIVAAASRSASAARLRFMPARAAWGCAANSR